ncbi:MAG: hypothetical protein N3E46_07505 [Gemmataceae bacterium]|jgi:hypothetical protein|nr:hypothetical protein [Gemmataceae bacterium]
MPPDVVPHLSPQEAVERLEEVLAHAWMVRTFLKHAEEIQGCPDMLAVPRTLFDTIRAVEPARQRGDLAAYLRRLQGKLAKLRRITQYYSEHYARFSPHTNYAMAALSLRGILRAMEDIFQRLDWEAVRQLPAVPPSRSAFPSAASSASSPAAPPASPSGSSPPSANPPSDPLDSLDIPEV